MNSHIKNHNENFESDINNINQTKTHIINHHHRTQHIRSHRHSNKSKFESSVKRTAGLHPNYNLQRDYIATTIGKDIQLDCKMNNLANDDDKVIKTIILFLKLQLPNNWHFILIIYFVNSRHIP